MRRIVPTIFSVLLLASCGRGERDYSTWSNIPAEGWAYSDTLLLTPADTALTDNDSLVRRPLRLGIVHSGDYQYSNLWLEVTYHGAGMVYRDTVNLRLADIYGRWLGQGFGSDYQKEVTLSPQADIDLTRPVGVRHIMRLDTLRHVMRVGISVR